MINTFILDEFQKKAIGAIDNYKNVLITAPTGSGKTLPAEYAIAKFCKKGGQQRRRNYNTLILTIKRKEKTS